MFGKTLGHCQITSQLGKCGMGEVFQAKDQKLGRDVAIKIPNFSSRVLQIKFTSWDVSRDGKRFLMIKETGSTNQLVRAAIPRKINIVLNWFEELKQPVPIK
jgi:serine/threonine protein kinase